MTSWVQILVDLPPAVSILLRVTVVLGVGWILHFCLGRANPRWRVLLWRGGVVGVFLVPMLLPLKYFEIGVQAPASPPSTITSLPVVSLPPAVEPDAATVEPVIEIADIDPTDSAAEAPPETLSISQSSFSIMPWARENVWLLLSLGWTLVAVVIAVRFVAAFVGIRRKVRSSVPGPKHLEVLLKRVAGDLNCGRKPALMCSTDFASPFLAGLMKPVIVLPERMTDSKYADELPAVFAHEIAHLRSRDLLWMAAVRCFGIVFWFHPLAWKLRDAHSTACEEVCDAVAADYVGNAESYSSTLAQIALEISGKIPAVGGIPMARSAKIMGRLRILKRKVYSCAPARRWVALFLLVGVVALTTIGGLRLVHAENSRNDNPEIAPTWPANTASADRKALTRVLDSMVAEQEKMPPFAMHIETKTSLPKRDRTSVEGEIHKIRMRYDIDRFDVSRERYDVFNGKAQPGYRYRHILSSDRNLNRQQYIGEPNQPVTAWLGGRKRARRILHDASTGGFLFDFLGDDKPIAEILRAADSVSLWDKAEDVDGFACHVIEGKTTYGRMKIWVDPSHGFRIRRATIHKVPGDLYHGIAIAENPAEDKLFGCREVHIEISDVRLGQANGWHFSRSEKMMMTITKHDGTEERIRYVTERSDVEINPDFEKLGAFVMDGIPDGTQLNNLDPEDFGYGYEWRDGQVRPLGGEGGRTVIGRVAPAAHANTHSKTSWADTDNVDAYVRTKQYRSNIHISRDGSFRVENVPPGAHELVVWVTEPMPDDLSVSRVIAEVTRAFEIEQEAGDVNEPIDLGELKGWKLTGQIKAGDRAPLFEAQCIDGTPFKLSDYRGRYVLVHFWATWCVPCIAEMPKLKEVYDLFGKDKRFAMIGLSKDKEEDPVKKYLAKNNIKWPQAWLGQGPQTAIASNYGAYGIPAVLLIGPDGKVIARDLRGEDIESQVAEALALSGRENNEHRRTVDKTEKLTPAQSNSTAPAPARAATADRGPANWGEAVEGVQMRVRAERQRWYEGETPRFLVDMRNTGAVKLTLGLTQESWEVELDGMWYSTGTAFDGVFPTLPFGPGAEHKDIRFRPEEGWEWNVNGRALKFPPGLHTVRLAFKLQPRDRAQRRRLRVVSNPVEIEVVAGEGRNGQVSYDGRTIEEWIRQFDSESYENRKEAIAALTQIGLPAVPAMIEQMKEGGMRASCARGVLGKMGPAAEDAVAWLIEVALDKDVSVGQGWESPAAYRENVLSCLNYMTWARDRVVPVLQRIAQDNEDDTRLRRVAVLFLRDVGKEAIPILRKLSQDDQSKIRNNAHHMLAQLLLKEEGLSKEDYYTPLIERDLFDASVPEYLAVMKGPDARGRPHTLTQRVKRLYRQRLAQEPDPQLANALVMIILDGLRNTELGWAAPAEGSKRRYPRQDPTENHTRLSQVMEIGFDHAESGSKLWRRFGMGLAKLRLLQGRWDDMNQMLILLDKEPIPKESRPWLAAPPADWKEDLASRWIMADQSMRSGNCSLVFRIEKDGKGLKGAHVLVKRAPEPTIDIDTGIRIDTLLHWPYPYSFGYAGRDRQMTRYAVSDESGAVRFDKLPKIPIKIEVLVPTSNFEEVGSDWDLWMEIEPGKYKMAKKYGAGAINTQEPPAVAELKAGATVHYPKLVVRPASEGFRSDVSGEASEKAKSGSSFSLGGAVREVGTRLRLATGRKKSKASKAKTAEVSEFLGLDLGNAPRTRDWAAIPELWEERPPGSRSYEIHSDARFVFTWLGGTVYNVAAKNVFYVQHDPMGSSHRTYYGPFEGDPYEVLNLEMFYKDLLGYSDILKVRPAIAASGATSRLFYDLETEGLSDEDKKKLAEDTVTALKKRLETAKQLDDVWIDVEDDKIQLTILNSDQCLERLGVDRKRKERSEAGERLYHLGKALRSYANDNQSRYPDTLQELQERGYIGRTDLKWALERVAYVGQGRSSAGTSDMLLVYDRQLLAEDGRTFVFFSNGRLDSLKADQLKQ